MPIWIRGWLMGPEAASGFRQAYQNIRGAELPPEVQRFWDLTAVVRALPGPGQWLDAFLHSGVPNLTSEDLETRFVDMVERLQ